jgi:hypothetical protein
VSTKQLELRTFLIELEVFFNEPVLVFLTPRHVLPSIAARVVVVVDVKVFEAAEVQ